MAIWGLGLLSLIPNAVPALMAFGVWSILVGQVDVASSIVAATSLGIIVDATSYVHFFIITGLLGIPAIVLVLFLMSRETREAPVKQAS